MMLEYLISVIVIYLRIFPHIHVLFSLLFLLFTFFLSFFILINVSILFHCVFFSPCIFFFVYFFVITVRVLLIFFPSLHLTLSIELGSSLFNYKHYEHRPYRKGRAEDPES